MQNQVDINDLRLVYGKRYSIEQVIGYGTFGCIVRAQCIETYQKVVIKQISLQVLEEQLIYYMQNEIKIMEKCQNENIIRLIESHQNENYIYIVMESCEMDLDRLLNEYFDYDKVPEQFVRSILKQLAKGFKYLHQMNIIHRDIKLENILVSCSSYQKDLLDQGQFDIIHKMIFKIADMGLCKNLENQNSLTQTYAGSPLNMAPEILLDKPYGFKADMYSLGVILYQMLYGEFPYEAKDISEDQVEVIRKQDAYFSNKNGRISQELIDLIKQMLEFDPEKRLDWQDLYDSEFFLEIPSQTLLESQEIQINQKVLNDYKNPELFKSAQEIKPNIKFTQSIVQDHSHNEVLFSQFELLQDLKFGDRLKQQEDIFEVQSDQSEPEIIYEIQDSQKS